MAKSQKVVKKKFFLVKIPILKKEIELLGSDIKEFNGKTIKLDLTHDLKGRSLDLKLVVIVKEKEAVAHPIEIKLFQSYMKRMVRNGVDYSEDSIKTKCLDNNVIIKPFMITRKRVNRPVLNGLRKKVNEELVNFLAKKNFEEVISDIISGKLQKEIQPKLKKVYPLSLFEIKNFGLNKKQEYQEPEKEKKVAKKKTVEEEND